MRIGDRLRACLCLVTEEGEISAVGMTPDGLARLIVLVTFFLLASLRLSALGILTRGLLVRFLLGAGELLF